VRVTLCNQIIINYRVGSSITLKCLIRHYKTWYTSQK